MLSYYSFLFLLIINSWATFTPIGLNKLQSGDLIFQTSTSRQSMAIMMATQSVYSHMGIIKRVGNKIFVVEAIGPVKETPLENWMRRGVLGRVTVIRHKLLTKTQAGKVLLEAKRYYGQPYDTLFRFNNGRLYCSELPYLTYQAVGLPVGRIQTISELNINTPAVESLMRSRWKADPVCSGVQSFKACIPKILKQELVTPVSILQDKNMIVIFNNYPPFLTALTNILKR